MVSPSVNGRSEVAPHLEDLPTFSTLDQADAEAKANPNYFPRRAPRSDTRGASLGRGSGMGNPSTRRVARSNAGPLLRRVGSWRPRLELVAGILRVDQAADVAAPADRETGKHELALMAPELRVVGPPEVGSRLGESLDRRHAPTSRFQPVYLFSIGRSVPGVMRAVAPRVGAAGIDGHEIAPMVRLSWNAPIRPLTCCGYYHR
jgi:hypothetical protein